MKKLFLFVSIVFISLCSTQTVVADAKTTVQDTPVVSATTDEQHSWEKKMAMGLFGVGYYEINSDWLSLYYGTTAPSTTTAGLGFGGFFEVGTSEKISIEMALGYSRLLSATRQRDTINESYFLADLVAHYHFHNKGSWDAYAIGGVGLDASGSAATPLVDLGIGSYYKLTNDGFYLKTELLVKSAVIFNRAEGRIGIGYEF